MSSALTLFFEVLFECLESGDAVKCSEPWVLRCWMSAQHGLSSDRAPGQRAPESESLSCHRVTQIRVQDSKPHFWQGEGFLKAT